MFISTCTNERFSLRYISYYNNDNNSNNDNDNDDNGQKENEYMMGYIIAPQMLVLSHHGVSSLHLHTRVE